MRERGSSVRTSGLSVLAAALVFALAAGGAGGCGESDQEAAFREATERMAEAETALAEAREEFEEKERDAEEAQEELTRAREELASAEAELAEARAQVGLQATDDVLFREVQTRLLEDELLDDVAIAARVEKGIVTLTGEAAAPKQRERAGEIAAAIPGVLGVDNRVDVPAR